jgi:tetratricopeptide (TPR) repeat protein
VGEAQRRLREPEKALKTFQEGSDILEKLTRENPGVPFYQSQLSANLEKLGHALMDTKQPAQALEAYDHARAIDERLTGLHPEVPWHQSQLGWNLYHMARCHFQLKERDRERSCYEQARDVVVRLVKAHPDRAAYHEELCSVLNNLGLTYQQLGDPRRGRQTLRQAAEEGRLAVEQAGHVERNRRTLDLAYRSLAAVERDLGLLDEAAATISKRLKLWPGDAHALYSAAREYALTAAQAGKGKTPPSADDQARRRWYTGQALDTLRRAVAAGFRDVKRLRSDTALESVRGRDEFRQLVAELEKKGRP